jgi:hypothetical protein
LSLAFPREPPNPPRALLPPYSEPNIAAMIEPESLAVNLIDGPGSAKDAEKIQPQALD